MVSKNSLEVERDDNTNWRHENSTIFKLLALLNTSAVKSQIVSHSTVVLELEDLIGWPLVPSSG